MATDIQYHQATKIILDNWTLKEDQVKQKIQNQLNLSEEDTKQVYESVMNHLISDLKVR